MITLNFETADYEELKKLLDNEQPTSDDVMEAIRRVPRPGRKAAAFSLSMQSRGANNILLADAIDRANDFAKQNRGVK